MGTISNRILISAINDGTTIHGSLRASASLSQGWNGSGCVPDWSSGGPTIYLTLFNGITAVAPLTYTWYYNGTAIFTQDSANNATYGGIFKNIKSYSSGGYKAVQIIGNLAAAGNLDFDLVRIDGTVEVGGAQVEFTAGVDISISEINANGWLGIVNFAGGKATLDSETDSVTMTAALYKETGPYQSTWTARWLLNGTAITSSVTGMYVLSNGGKTLQLFGAAVTDIATVTCEMYDGSTVSTSTYATGVTVVVDDTRDAEYLHIRYTMEGTTVSSDGSPLSLHTNQKATYKMWVATASDPNAVNSAFTKYEALPHNSGGTVIGSSNFSSASGSPLYGGTYSSNWCNITATVTTDNGTSTTGGQFAVHYTDVKSNGSNLSIIVKAT